MLRLPNHSFRSAVAALMLPLVPSAILRVMSMGASQRHARNAARTSLSGGGAGHGFLTIRVRKNRLVSVPEYAPGLAGVQFTRSLLCSRMTSKLLPAS